LTYVKRKHISIIYSRKEKSDLPIEYARFDWKQAMIAEVSLQDSLEKERKSIYGRFFNCKKPEGNI